MSTLNGLTGTRIFRPRMSSALAIGRVLDVVSRKPLSHIFSNDSRPAFCIEARTNAPSLPSIAAHTCE